MPHEAPDTRWLYLSDVLPTAWQAVGYASIPAGGTVAVYGLGPIGQMSARHGVEILDSRDHDDVALTILDMTSGRGADAVIDAVRKSMGSLKRGGTLSISGVYAGLENAFPLGDLFDKQITIRMGQANVRRWVDDLVPLLTDEDPLGTSDLATHLLSLDQAPHGYEIFQRKSDGAIKIVLQP